MLFLKNEVQINKTSIKQCFLSQNKSVRQKLAQSWKYENRTKKRYMPFLYKSLQL